MSSARDRLSREERETELAAEPAASRPTDWKSRAGLDAAARTIAIAEQGTLRDRQQVRESVTKAVGEINEQMKLCGTKINGKRSLTVDEWLALPIGEQKYVRESLQDEVNKVTRNGGVTVIFKGR